MKEICGKISCFTFDLPRDSETRIEMIIQRFLDAPGWLYDEKNGYWNNDRRPSIDTRKEKSQAEGICALAYRFENRALIIDAWVFGDLQKKKACCITPSFFSSKVRIAYLSTLKRELFTKLAIAGASIADTKVVKL